MNLKKRIERKKGMCGEVSEEVKNLKKRIESLSSRPLPSESRLLRISKRELKVKKKEAVGLAFERDLESQKEN